jgi:Family of unknown function (DUF5681)
MDDSTGYGKPPRTTQFQPGQSGNPAGRKPGSKNRSTVARRVLDLAVNLPSHKLSRLQQMLPDLTADIDVEMAMTLALALRAIAGDVNAYKALMDSAYGAPKQVINSDDALQIIWLESKTYDEELLVGQNR